MHSLQGGPHNIAVALTAVGEGAEDVRGATSSNGENRAGGLGLERDARDGVR